MFDVLSSFHYYLVKPSLEMKKERQILCDPIQFLNTVYRICMHLYFKDVYLRKGWFLSLHLTHAPCGNNSRQH